MESATFFDLLIKLPGRTGQISSYFNGFLKILIHVHRYLCTLSMTLHSFLYLDFIFWGGRGPPDQFEPVTEEYRRHGGLWTTSTVLLSQQIQPTFSPAGEQQNSDAIEKVVSEIPWHHEAVTAARTRWAAAAVELEAQAQKKELEQGAAQAQSKGDKIRAIADAAAAKMRQEMKEKEKKGRGTTDGASAPSSSGAPAPPVRR